MEHNDKNYNGKMSFEDVMGELVESTFDDIFGPSVEPTFNDNMDAVNQQLEEYRENNPEAQERYEQWLKTHESDSSTELTVENFMEAGYKEVMDDGSLRPCTEKDAQELGLRHR